MAPKCKDEWGANRKKSKYTQKRLGATRKYEYTVHGGDTGTGGSEGDTSIFKGTPRTGKPWWRWGRDREEGFEDGDEVVGEGKKCGRSEEDVGDAAEHADVEAGAPSTVVVRDVDLRYGVDGVRTGRGVEGPRRREQSKDGGVGVREWLGPRLEQTGCGGGRGNGEEGSFRPGGRPRSGGMSRASLMLDSKRRISRSAE